MKTFTGACAAVLCILVMASPGGAAAAKPRPALVPGASDALTRGLARGELTQAEYALERARSLFALGSVRREFGDVARPDPRAATAILRDLAARFRFLSAADRAAARSILARPTERSDRIHSYARSATVSSACDSTRPLCFHWVTSTRDAATAGNVADTMATFAAVYDLEVEAYGYLPPLSDVTSRHNEGNGNTDIYLADLGGDPAPVFGYCTTDDPNAFSASYPYFDVSAYCVVDEDFTNSVYGGIDPDDAREVTAAHEFFHAVQFGYDWFEDLWLMEGTAMLMEGQYRPDVDDRLRYLANSVLTAPSTPVDRGANGFEYGAWILWRFLIESMDDPPVPAAPTPPNPLLVRQIWERADASSDRDGPGPDTVGPDQYSLQATRQAVGDRGLQFGPLFGQFARVNRFPHTFYEEGASYPQARVSTRYTLRPAAKTTGWQSTRLLHLASRYYVFKPGNHASRSARLRIAVDVPRPSHGSRAGVLIRFADGSVDLRELPLDSAGIGHRTVPFGRDAVKAVNLVLTNASTRMRCGRNTVYSCTGIGADDLRTYTFRAKLR